LKFLRDDDTFDAATFQKVVELVITAMDISICFADFPTESIGVTTRDYRQLGIGYANLGALLMATGHGYDSDGGRALAAASPPCSPGRHTSARPSWQVSSVRMPVTPATPRPTSGSCASTRRPTTRSAPSDAMANEIHEGGDEGMGRGRRAGERNGFRNAQASVLAPPAPSAS
jgi:ribonucleoside-diphosphate reductase alpha chain